MHRIVLFDFDGTLIRGDSTKIVFEQLFSSKVSFVINYYLRHPVSLLKFIVTGEEKFLRESRRAILASRYNKVNVSQLRIEGQNRIFKCVYSRAISHLKDGCTLVIISAGYSEIIRLILGDDLQYEVIANSLFEKELEIINHQKKVTRLNLRYSRYSVIAAYGNTYGDIPMLRLAAKGYWVEGDGEILDLTK